MKMGLGPIFRFTGWKPGWNRLDRADSWAISAGVDSSRRGFSASIKDGRWGRKMLRDQLTALLEPVVRDLGLDLWELEFAARSNGGLLRLYIDSEAGITVEDCAQTSHAVSEVLDANDPIPGFYTLEVSSPGTDRVLRTHAHFARFVGESVRLETLMPVDGRKRFSGRLQDVSKDAITLQVDGTELVLPLSGIHKARLAPELEVALGTDKANKKAGSKPGSKVGSKAGAKRSRAN